MRQRAVLAALFAAAAACGPAWGQARSPAERQTLTDLAYVLGESHALRQACAGPTDQYWRSRMTALLKTEAPDPALDRQLKVAFNTGFAAAQAAYPRCTRAVARQEAAAAARGSDLATSLTAPVAEDDPSR